MPEQAAYFSFFREKSGLGPFRTPRKSLSTQARLPVFGHSSFWSGHWLILRMPPWSGELFSVHHLLSFVAIKPRFSRLETCNDWMAGLLEVSGRVLAGRAVAATDMTALCAPSQVKPPAVRRQTFSTAVSTRHGPGVDALMLVFHHSSTSGSTASLNWCGLLKRFLLLVYPIYPPKNLEINAG
jgi:hypothetical protein